jgi:rhodanese-related sulfurtransferase
MSAANTSKHLQVLLNAKLVTFSKDKNFVYYALADEKVIEVLQSTKSLAEIQFSDLGHLREDHIERGSKVEVLSLEDMMAQVESGEAVLIDVRPEDEYEGRHIPGSLSIPVENLEAELACLPKGKKVIAYCRGSYCEFATQAVEILKSSGYEAYRIAESIHHWELSDRGDEAVGES